MLVLSAHLHLSEAGSLEQQAAAAAHHMPAAAHLVGSLAGMCLLQQGMSCMGTPAIMKEMSVRQVAQSVHRFAKLHPPYVVPVE